MKLLLFISFFNFFLYGQINNSSPYVELIKNIEKKKEIDFLVINDYYYNLKPQGVTGYIYSDTLRYNNNLRADIDSLNEQFKWVDSIIFKNVKNYADVKEIVMSFLLSHPQSEIKLMIIQSPINNQGFYNYLYTEKNYQLIVPILYIKGHLNEIEISNSIIVIEKRKKIKLKKVIQSNKERFNY